VFKRTVVIGCGGIFSQLWPLLGKFSSLHPAAPKELLLVDKDRFSMSNLERQDMRPEDAGRSKAELFAERLKYRHSNLDVKAVAEFVTAANAAKIIPDRSLVFSAVDNHATRKVLSEHARTLRDIVIISGMNYETGGASSVYAVLEGKEASQRLEHVYDEIANPKDKNPGDVPCADLENQPGGEQQAITNAFAAIFMNHFFVKMLGEIPKGPEALAALLGHETEICFEGGKIFRSCSYKRISAPVLQEVPQAASGYELLKQDLDNRQFPTF